MAAVTLRSALDARREAQPTDARVSAKREDVLDGFDVSRCIPERDGYEGLYVNYRPAELFAKREKVVVHVIRASALSIASPETTTTEKQ